MRQLLILALLPFAITAGCAGEDKGDEDDEGTSDDSGGGGGTGNSDGVSPSIVEADAWCYLHETGDSFYQWTSDAIAEDPQGNATIESLYDAGITVKAGDAELAVYTLVCDSDGNCFGSFKEDEHGVSCANASSYTLSFTVIDEDGNISEPYEVTGREGSSASGK